MALAQALAAADTSDAGQIVTLHLSPGLHESAPLDFSTMNGVSEVLWGPVIHEYGGYHSHIYEASRQRLLLVPWAHPGDTRFGHVFGPDDQ